MVFYWLIPYSNKMDLWPQWRSPLVWDIFAISTYLIVSLLFWYIGWIPDLATPLVVSVHSVVSLDFAIGNTPGYHSTIFPPYFVVGALFSGFAMVLTLAIPLRHFFGLQDFITERHLGNAAKIILATRWLVAYGYFMEIFTAYYSADQYDIYMTGNRMHGPYAPVYWALMIGARDLAFPRLNLLSW